MRPNSDQVIAAEALQRAAWERLSRCAGPVLSDRLAIRVRQSDGTLFQASKRVAGLQFNKIFSFGLAGPVDADAVAEAADWIRSNCAGQALLMVPPTARDAATDALLRVGGFVRHPLDLRVFHRRLVEPVEPPPADRIEVRAVAGTDAALFGAVLAEGFDVPLGAPWLAAVAADPEGARGYLAFDGNEPAGAGALFLQGEWAWLFIGAVRPAFRNRGVQTALLRHRIAEAWRLGARQLAVAALRPVPDHAGNFASFRNIERLGFACAYDRPNYVLAG